MKKRILIVAPYNNGTIGLCSLNLFNAFKQRTDCDVKCVCVHKFANGHNGFEECESCVSFAAPIYLKWLSMLKQIFWLKKIKKQFKPDITISTLFGCSTINVLAGGKDFKIGVFHSPHKQAKKEGFLNYFATLITYYLVYPFLDRLFCVSEEVRDSLHPFKFIKKEKIKVVYNIHFPDTIRQKSMELIANQDEMNILSKPTIIYCGRLDKNKAPDRAIIAFANSSKPQDAQLVFIGNDKDNMKESLVNLAKKYSIENSVHFWGKKENPYPYMRASKALISSSYSEGLPGVMIEALIIGTPIVATNSSMGVWEICSCANQYNAKLNTIHKCYCGIISSNMGKSQNQLLDLDIANLSESISQVFNYEKINNFLFEENIQSSNVILNY